jgi:hypothetical protein
VLIRTVAGADVASPRDFIPPASNFDVTRASEHMTSRKIVNLRSPMRGKERESSQFWIMYEDVPKLREVAACVTITRQVEIIIIIVIIVTRLPSSWAPPARRRWLKALIDRTFKAATQSPPPPPSHYSLFP